MAIINWLFKRTQNGVHFADAIVRKYVVEIPRLDKEQKVAAKKALRKAFKAGAEYGTKRAHDAAEEFGEGVVNGITENKNG